MLVQLSDVLAESEVAIFGHSLGAVLAFELARRLEKSAELSVRHLFVSGSPGPWSRREDRASGMSDTAFLARVREFAGYDHPALVDEELRELILPTLRADVEMHETYRAVDGARVSAPVTALLGVDDSLVSTEEAGDWARATTSAFHLSHLPGGHMYLTEQPAAVLQLIADTLTASVGSGGATP
jgi:surfactin synthase thioesterase subunit